MQGPQQSRGDENPAAAPDQLQDGSRGNNRTLPVEFLKEKTSNLSEGVNSKAAAVTHTMKEKAESVIEAARGTADDFMDTPKVSEGGPAPQSGVGLEAILRDSADEDVRDSRKHMPSAADGKSSFDMKSLRDRAKDAAGAVKETVAGAVKETVAGGAQEMKKGTGNMDEGFENREVEDTNRPSADDLVSRGRGWDTSSTLVESIKEKALHASEAVKDKSLAAPEKIMESLKNASGVAKEQGENVSGWARETAKQAVKTVEDVSNTIMGSADDTSDTVGQNAADIHEGGDKRKEESGSVLQSVKQSIGEASQAVGEKAGSAMDSVKQRPESLEQEADKTRGILRDGGTPSVVEGKAESEVGSVKRATGDDSSVAEEKTRKTADSAKETAESSKDDSKSGSESAQEMVGAGVRTVKEKVGDMVGSMKEGTEAAKSKVKEKTGEMVDSSKEASESAKREVGGSAESVKSKLGSGLESTEELVGDGVKKVKDQAGDAANQVRDKSGGLMESAKNVTDSAKSKLESTEEKVGDGVKEVKDKAGDMGSAKNAGESVIEKAESKTESAKETTTGSIEAAKQGARSTSDSLREKIRDGVEKVNEGVGNAQQSARSVRDSLTEKTEDGAETVKEKAQQTARSASDSLKEKTEDGAETVEEKAADSAETVNEKAREASDSLEQKTADGVKPVKEAAGNLIESGKKGAQSTKEGVESATEAAKERAKESMQPHQDKAGGDTGPESGVTEETKDHTDSTVEGQGSVKAVNRQVPAKSDRQSSEDPKQAEGNSSDTSVVPQSSVAIADDILETLRGRNPEQLKAVNQSERNQQSSENGTNKSPLIGSMKEKAHEVSQAAKRVAGDASEIARENVDTASGGTRRKGVEDGAKSDNKDEHRPSAMESVKEEGNYVADSLKEIAGDASEKVGKTAAATSESLKERAEGDNDTDRAEGKQDPDSRQQSLLGSIKEKAGSVTQWAKNLTGLARRNVEDYKETEHDRAEPGRTAVDTPVREPEQSRFDTDHEDSSPAESMMKTTEDAKEKARQEVEKVKDKADSAVEEGRELADDTAQLVKDKVGKLGEWTKNASGMAGQETEGSRDFVDGQLHRSWQGRPAENPGTVKDIVKERADRLVEEMRAFSSSEMRTVDHPTTVDNAPDVSVVNSAHSTSEIRIIDHPTTIDVVHDASIASVAIPRVDSIGDPGERAARAFMATLPEAQDALL